jgi:ribosome-binding protein aMBF1 (putative translation factor)
MLCLPCQFLSLGKNSRKSLQRKEQDKLRAVIAEARVAAGMSQRELSRRLDMPLTYVARVERGERMLDVVEFIDLVVALGQNPTEVLDRITFKS